MRMLTLQSWIERGDLAYFRAIREVPLEMRQKMPGEYQLSLDNRVCPLEFDHPIKSDIVRFDRVSTPCIER